MRKKTTSPREAQLLRVIRKAHKQAVELAQHVGEPDSVAADIEKTLAAALGKESKSPRAVGQGEESLRAEIRKYSGLMLSAEGRAKLDRLREELAAPKQSKRFSCAKCGFATDIGGGVPHDCAARSFVPFKKDDVLVPHDGKYPIGAVRVEKVDAETFTAFPEGGGRGYRFDQKAMDKFKFRVVSEAEKAAASLKRGVFSLDSMEGSFPGWWNGRRWNGWATPLFERAEFERLCDVLGGRFDPKTETGIFTGEGFTDNDDEPLVIEGTVNKDLGIKVWSFDGWCFWDDSWDGNPAAAPEMERP